MAFEIIDFHTHPFSKNYLKKEIEKEEKELAEKA